MSAREESMDHLVNSLLHQGPYSTHEAKSLAEKLIDDLLHEEAEKVREELPPTENPLFLSEWAEGLLHAADLIDPHVK